MITLVATGCFLAYPIGLDRVAIGQYVNLGIVHVPPSHVFYSPVDHPVLCKSGSGWILYLRGR